MDPSDFFTASRILIVAGKGGVGKTTVTATLGVAAARSGLDTLLVEIEGKRGLGSLFGAPDLVYHDTELTLPGGRSAQHGRLRARTLGANDALVDYFEDHGLRRFGRFLTRMQVLDTLATSTPGLKDLILLGKIKQLERAGTADLILVDAPASGHAISFLRAAASLQDAVDTGPIRRQADEVDELLRDPARSRVLLVTLPEETPVNELIETAYALEEDVAVSLGPLVVNAVFPERTIAATEAELDQELALAVDAACDFWRRRADSQSDQIRRLAEELPLEQIHLPRIFTTELSPADLADLAGELEAQVATLRFQR